MLVFCPEGFGAVCPIDLSIFASGFCLGERDALDVALAEEIVKFFLLL